MSLLGIADKKTSTAALSVASNTLLIALKVVVGLLIGSVAVLSEAAHSAMDLVAAIIAFFAVRASGRAADKDHPYGHGKFENVSGVVEALLIFAAAGWIIYEAVGRLLEPQPLDMPFWGVGVMFISAVVNTLVSRRLSRVGKEADSVALRADALHLRTDVYTSLGVMGALLVVWIVTFVAPAVDIHWLDPAVAIGVALFIMKAAFDLTREAARDLVDSSLPEKDTNWIADFVRQNWPEVRSFHHLQTRKAGPNRFIDFHVVVDENMSVAESHALADDIVVSIKERLPGSRVHIHVEPCDQSCKRSCAEGCTEQANASQLDKSEYPT
ncbi:MAG: cation diffusion facilitator family transporter [Thermoleophilia bacterium]|nr:cation diffusion facilitator family transporter [Thermoleophilia bacterium]